MVDKGAESREQRSQDYHPVFARHGGKEAKTPLLEKRRGNVHICCFYLIKI
jgi:hypothetical protein